MKTFEFTIVPADVSEMTDDLADALFEAGCDDGSPFSRDGVAGVGFSREADSLEEAIRTAMTDVRKAGVRVARVEPADPPVFSRINAELVEAGMGGA